MFGILSKTKNIHALRKAVQNISNNLGTSRKFSANVIRVSRKTEGTKNFRKLLISLGNKKRF